MATTIAAAVADFINALTGVLFSLLNSVLAFFQAIAVLGKDIISSAVNVVQSFVALVLGLLQGVYGFVAGMHLFFVFASVKFNLLQPIYWRSSCWEEDTTFTRRETRRSRSAKHELSHTRRMRDFNVLYE
ncbi:hypothetical protein B0H12DRAFT_1086456 [Mycena haematopus]|nr:hypothetical protein B0H12DRAFT_1086456 [Mycena haematopus]